MSEAGRLAAWSEAVRESTLKRLRKVPADRVNWRPDPGAMSFADLARHLLACDTHLARSITEGPQPADHGELGPDVDAAGFARLVDELERSGARRSRLIAGVTDLVRPLEDERFGTTDVWWVIVRGNLDHEVHHRGQIAAYVRACRG